MGLWKLLLLAEQVTRIAQLTVACVAHTACPDGPTAVREPVAPGYLPGSVPTTFVRGELLLTGPDAGRLVDVRGRVVKRLAAGKNDLRGLAAGIYFVHPPDRALPVRRLILI